MKLTLAQIVSINQEVKGFFESKLNGKLAYKMSVLKRRTDKFAASFEEVRTKLINEFGTEIKDENGNSWKDAKTSPEFWKEYNELLATEEEIDLPTISLDELENIDATPKFYEALGDEVITK